jgi:hypothetical protein
VRPQTTVITLAPGETITVKTRLTAGEQREAYARLYTAGADGKLRVNPLQSGLAMMTTYLVDWNLTDDDGALVPIRGVPIEELEAALDNLDPDDYAEIKAAIEAHEATQRAVRAALKKTLSGSPADGPTSLSPSESAGVLTGSAT